MPTHNLPLQLRLFFISEPNFNLSVRVDEKIFMIFQNDFGNMNIHGMPAPPLDLPAPPADLPAPPNVFQQEIISQIEFTPKPGFISRGPNDPNWAPRQYIQKGMWLNIITF